MIAAATAYKSPVRARENAIFQDGDICIVPLRDDVDDHLVICSGIAEGVPNVPSRRVCAAEDQRRWVVRYHIEITERCHIDSACLTYLDPAQHSEGPAHILG